MKSWKVRGRITTAQYKYNNGMNTQQTVIHATNSPTVKREEGPRRRQKNRGRPKHTEAEDNVTRAEIKYQIRSLAGPQCPSVL